MQDLDYVRQILSGDYETSRPDELPYPDLKDVMMETVFDYLAGTVFGERTRGTRDRDQREYLGFDCGDKFVYSHRFIVAVTLGKWPPRDLDVDHINNNPSDNRPENLRVVTRRDNAGNRRKAKLSELYQLSEVADGLKQSEDILPRIEEKPLIPEEQFQSQHMTELRNTSDQASGVIRYTGETKSAKYGGAWYKTNLESWHLLYEPPDEIG